MSENLGDIYYTVDAKTDGLITVAKKIESATDSMNKNFKKTDGIATKLTATFAAVTAAISTNKVIAYADAWATVNNKLANSIKQNEKLADVTERVFNIAQNTRSSVDATASLYARLERATRDYGTSATDLIKLTETINRGFIVSGATAQEAENAVIQLSQGLGSGALRGEEFNSVNEQGNRLIVALADSLGKTTGEMRALAAQGKLTTDVVVSGLLKQSNTIEKEYNKTLATFAQNTQKAEQNLMRFVGENNTVKEVVSAAGKAMVVASDSINIIAQSATIFAAVLSARLMPALIESTMLTIQSVAAKGAAAKADAAAAAAALRRAEAEKIAALTVLQSAKLDMQAAAGSNAYAFAKDNLTRASARAATAVGAYNVAAAASVAASARAASAATAMGLAMKAGGAALALIGGPAGAAFLAAAAIVYYYTTAETAEETTKRLSGEVDTLSESFRGLNAAQRQVAISKLNTEMDAVRQKMIAANSEIERLSKNTKSVKIGEMGLNEIKISNLKKEVDGYSESLNSLSMKQQALFQSGLPSITNSTEEVKKSGTVISDEVKKIIDSLLDERKQLTMTADGYEEYALRKQLAAAEASEAVIQASLRELKAQQELRKELEIMEQVDADTQTQKLKVQTDYEQTGQQITSELETPAQKAERELAERLEVIRTYNALETAEDAKKTEMGMLALDAYAAKMQEINAQTMESNFASTLSDSFVGLQNQISGTMAQVALGFKDGDEAAKSLATTILTELVGAMINYGIKQAWAYTFGAAASTAAAATQTTAAVAATTAATTVSITSAAAIAAAWATPAALVSAATFGASAVAGAAALAAAVASSGAMALASQSINAGIGSVGAIAGGKLYGGTVQSGTMYPVNENGAPELFQSGNKQYLMPNSRGEVISNKDASSGGSSSGETMVNFTYSPNIQALDSDGVATILAEQQETLWNLVQRAANERGRKL